MRDSLDHRGFLASLIWTGIACCFLAAAVVAILCLFFPIVSAHPLRCFATIGVASFLSGFAWRGSE